MIEMAGNTSTGVFVGICILAFTLKLVAFAARTYRHEEVTDSGVLSRGGFMMVCYLTPGVNFLFGMGPDAIASRHFLEIVYWSNILGFFHLILYVADWMSFWRQLRSASRT